MDKEIPGVNVSYNKELLEEAHKLSNTIGTDINELELSIRKFKKHMEDTDMSGMSLCVLGAIMNKLDPICRQLDKAYDVFGDIETGIGVEINKPDSFYAGVFDDEQGNG